MGWILKNDKPCLHPDRPADSEIQYPYLVGSLWKCDDCTQIFEVRDQKYLAGGQYTDTYEKTRQIWVPGVDPSAIRGSYAGNGWYSDQ